MLPDSITTPAGLQIRRLAHGGLQRISAAGVSVTLFPGHEAEAPAANLWLRHHRSGGCDLLPLLGPGALLAPLAQDLGQPATLAWAGRWQDVQLRLQLQAADLDGGPDGEDHGASAWYWHLQLQRDAGDSLEPLLLDLVLVQDVALAAYGAIRTNEFYVSHYLDLSPLSHPACGRVVAVRQNLTQAGGRHPWSVAGSLRQGTACATDGLQVLGLARRAGEPPAGLRQGLPDARRQHEHALVAVQDAPLSLRPGESVQAGFFMAVWPDHALATGAADLARVQRLLDRPEAQASWPAPAPIPTPTPAAVAPVRPSRFATAPWLATQDLSEAELQALFGAERRQAERDDQGRLLSFFAAPGRHVVLRDKELQVLRPHGHLLRSGRHQVPDECGLTSTVWMGGVFHSMVTQGHVGINRCLSTVRGYLGQFRSHGLRLFVRCTEADGSGPGEWQQLGLPSAFVVEPERCHWFYRHGGPGRGGLIAVEAGVEHEPHALTLRVVSLGGAPIEWRATLHLALGGDDGLDGVPVPWQHQDFASGPGLRVQVPAGGELASRFPQGHLDIAPLDASAPLGQFGHRGGEAWLLGMPSDEAAQAGSEPSAGLAGSDGLPFVVVGGGPTVLGGLRLTVSLLPEAAAPELYPAAEPGGRLPQWQIPEAAAGCKLWRQLGQLAEILPWYRHNALVHYLSPRGLEQFSGGGWGTRDVCQGPLEMLLALDQPAPVRDLLCRVFAAQDAGGDWPQWFMFFERERQIRAGDSHGDIVFWPLLGLARYLLASGDAALLDEVLPFHAAPGQAAEQATLWQHVQCALGVIAGRRIAGTALAAYGHGDWNDSLQPADPALREHLCSAWTVTLHHQMLTTLARALHTLGRGADAAPFEAEAAQVRADFQRLLVVDGVVCGYLLVQPGQAPQPLLHPADALTGVRASLLPIMHAMLEDLLTPEQARAHLALVREQLLGPDGARLFDRPLPYRGGPEQLFQRAESSAFFGREIGVMYTHAHLRWAETLAHLGEARALLDALSLAHPVGLRERLPQAGLRQSNCYYSSSDAAFADRYEAGREYGRIHDGRVTLDGGWRIYSSGPGIAIGIVIGRLLGLRREARRLLIDPVLVPELQGLSVRLPLVDGHEVELQVHLPPSGGQGHGPQRLALDGLDLPFSREPNPYRLGAAAVDLGLLRQRLKAGAPGALRRLEVWLG
ncbi:MAG: hypothetical protein KBC73_15900 [Burkholderiaceae bacterium]|nr:hypothetical protein [Burkholderiaceae bacterium]